MTLKYGTVNIYLKNISAKYYDIQANELDHKQIQDWTVNKPKNKIKDH